jgi:hypothetical protein
MKRTILRLREISERTGIPYETLRHYRRTGTELGPYLFRLGRNVVCEERDLDSWIEEQRQLDGARRA